MFPVISSIFLLCMIYSIIHGIFCRKCVNNWHKTKQLNSSPIALNRVKWRHIMLCSRWPQKLYGSGALQVTTTVAGRACSPNSNLVFLLIFCRISRIQIKGNTEYRHFNFHPSRNQVIESTSGTWGQFGWHQWRGRNNIVTIDGERGLWSSSTQSTDTVGMSSLA